MICCFPFFIFGMLKYFSKDNIILLMLVPLRPYRDQDPDQEVVQAGWLMKK